MSDTAVYNPNNRNAAHNDATGAGRVRMTPAAAKRIASQIEERGHGVGLRLGVKQYGCSGYGYEMDYAESAAADEAVFEEHGAKIVVKQTDLTFLAGITVDFRRDGLNQVFVFKNPNVEDACGCGESFTLKS